MSLEADVLRYVSACYTAMWGCTMEPEDFIDELEPMCDREGFLLYQHDPKLGLRTRKVVEHKLTWAPVEHTAATGARNPAAVLSTLGIADCLNVLVNYEVPERNQIPGGKAKRGNVILCIWHAHLYGEGFLEDFRTVMRLGETNRIHLIFMSHQIKPLELLRPRMAIIQHELPDRAQLSQLARAIATNPEDIPSEEIFQATVAASAGMTRIEARNAFSLSIIDHGHLNPETVFKLKAQLLKTGNQSLVLYDGLEPDGFKDIGGMPYLKRVSVEMLTNKPKVEIPKAKPLGLVLVGLPGVGKDVFGRALGREVHRPVLEWYPGRSRGGIQGQTEANTVEVFRKAERMAPSILVISEVEKLFTGLKSSGMTDGGVKANQIGEVLIWLSKPKDVYVIVTCNDVTAINNEMPEFLREGRFDELFFLDYPCREAKDQIWAIHLRGYGHLMEYGIKPRSMTPPEEEPSVEEVKAAVKKIELPSDKEWTGAEIEACCRKSIMRGKPLTEVMVRCVARSASNVIEANRAWALDNAMTAEYEGLYEGPKKHEQLLHAVFDSGSGRSIRRNKPSNN